jgi:hypothetical protein
MTNRIFGRRTYSKFEESRLTTGTVVSLLALAVLASLTACGNMKSNPTSDYPELKDAQRPTVEAVPKQEGMSLIPLDLKADDKGQQRNFVVGKQGTIDLSALADSGIETTVELTEKPEDSMQIRNVSPGKWQVVYTPSAAVLGSKDSDVVYATAVMRVTKSVYPDYKKFTKVLELAISVRHEGGAGFVGAPAKSAEIVTQGQNVNITLRAKDPISPETVPTVSVVEDANASPEGGLIPAAKFVTVVGSKKVGEGEYEFTLNVMTAGMQLPGQEQVVPARFNVVLSTGSRKSVDTMSVEIKVKRTAKAAQTTPPAAAPATVAPKGANPSK